MMPYILQPWDDTVDSEYMINNSDVFIYFFQENTKAEEMIRHIVDQYSLKNSLYL